MQDLLAQLRAAQAAAGEPVTPAAAEDVAAKDATDPGATVPYKVCL